jgi:hypothetical protein
MMPVCDLRMMAGGLMVARLIVLGRFPMMFRGALVMVGRVLVMLCAFMCRHLLGPPLPWGCRHAPHGLVTQQYRGQIACRSFSDYFRVI